MGMGKPIHTRRPTRGNNMSQDIIDTTCKICYNHKAKILVLTKKGEYGGFCKECLEIITPIIQTIIKGLERGEQ